MSTAWVPGAALTGLLLAPWLRRAIERHAVPAGQPWRRACPRCAAPRRGTPPYAGRCPRCRTPVGAPPLLVEAVAAAAFALVALLAGTPWELAAYGWLAGFGVVLAFVDVAVHRLPDRLTLPAFAGAGVLLTAAALTDGRPAAAGRAVLIGLAVAAFYLVLVLIYPAGMGFGDVKLALATGTVLGWHGGTVAALGTAGGFVLSGLLAVALLVIGRAGRGTELPHGPFMLLGVLAGLALTA
ncbi:leader peptidase (prepilin peptidase) / N-methyltransferase [Micromonospora pattaloongensis]|uniref:Leader peptidase (Prepilin peptidase) / N-methyltransferase n=1 Tax=Micromonospora pattaloongensis TaxID=405436 RepID=A0A1H3NQG4_9ACTN|nr:A24 family peptidase [Micromonospora pattaloongensis]SDY90685.1 leader peptidase (prepilin peptidase) / N-methyltransferase [Micromonospora pattaloongensis]